MNQKKLIIFISILFVLCSGYLFWVSDQGLKSDDGKDWWALYFENPKNDSLNFVIENYSSSSDFHWTVSENNQKISEGDAKVKSGETRNIQPQTENLTGKISVTVSNGKEKKEIYKNFAN
jgi:hypothetical protein